MIDLLGPAQRCLDFFATYWTEKGWPLPERRYIAPGATLSVADDADQLVVSLTSSAPGAGLRGGGNPSRGLSAQATPNVTYAVRLIRCTYVTDDTVPDAELLHTEGVRSMLDAARLLDTLIRWRGAEKLDVSLNASTELGQLEPAGPDGGVVGHLASFTISQFASVPG